MNPTTEMLPADSDEIDESAPLATPEDAKRLQAAIRSSESVQPPKAPDTKVDLLVPLEKISSVYVRELTGRDEEALSPFVIAGDRPGLANKVLELGVKDLSRADRMLISIGDRDRIVAKVREVTFGSEMQLRVACPQCNHSMGVTYDVNEPTDYPYDEAHTTFTTPRGHVVTLRWPNVGDVEELFKNTAISSEKRNTLLLARVIDELDGMPATNRTVLDMPVIDRRGVLAHIAAHAPGPRYDALAINCEMCDTRIPVSADAMLMFL